MKKINMKGFRAPVSSAVELDMLPSYAWVLKVHHEGALDRATTADIINSNFKGLFDSYSFNSVSVSFRLNTASLKDASELRTLASRMTMMIDCKVTVMLLSIIK